MVPLTNTEMRSPKLRGAKSNIQKQNNHNIKCLYKRTTLNPPKEFIK